MKTFCTVLLLFFGFSVSAQAVEKGTNSNFYLTISVKSSDPLLSKQVYRAENRVGSGQCHLNGNLISFDSIPTLSIYQGDTVLSEYIVADGLQIVPDLPLGMNEPMEAYVFLSGSEGNPIDILTRDPNRYFFYREFFADALFKVQMLYSSPTIRIKVIDKPEDVTSSHENSPLITQLIGDNIVGIHTSDDNPVSLEIYTMSGALLMKQSVMNHQTLNIQEFSPGTYLFCSKSEINPKQQLVVVH